MTGNESFFLAFEGLDGSGKSTLIDSVAFELKRRSIGHRLTREPGGTPLAEEIRKLILRIEGDVPVSRAEMLLYAASRAQHVDRVIKPSLEKGDWVLCDRFTASSVAFQSFARNISRTSVDWLNHFAIDGANPDLNILLNLSVDESRKRQGHRQKTGQAADRMEREKEDFHEAVRSGYLAQAKENPERWLVLDAAQTPDLLFKQLVAELSRRKWLV